jgi:glycosyltransferase involved in cell wall biosynthesis
MLIFPNHSLTIDHDLIHLESAEADLLRAASTEFSAVDLAGFVERRQNTSLSGTLSRDTVAIAQLNLFSHLNSKLSKIVNYITALVLMPFSIARYDVIYIFCPGYCALIAAFWSRLLRKRYGFYVRGTWLSAKGGTSILWKTAFRGARFMIVTGEAFRKRLLEFNSRVVNEVPLTKLRPANVATGLKRRSQAVQKLVFAGRLTETKGILDLVRALAKLRANGHHQLTLTIAGGGLPEELLAIKTLATTLGVLENIDLVGHVTPNELSAIYETSDIFVFPSYFPEGFPRVLYEAMMFGLAIVTTKMPGIDGFLFDGINCLYCEPRNPESITEQLTRLIKNPERTGTLASAANRDVTRLFQSFEHESHAQQLVHLASEH